MIWGRGSPFAEHAMDEVDVEAGAGDEVDVEAGDEDTKGLFLVEKKPKREHYSWSCLWDEIK